MRDIHFEKFFSPVELFTYYVYNLPHHISRYFTANVAITPSCLFNGFSGKICLFSRFRKKKKSYLIYHYSYFLGTCRQGYSYKHL